MMDLDRKYRPQDLDEVIGQDHIVTSLKHKMETQTLPQAYLFQGPSGTGKTTLARIIAKHLNCVEANIIEVDAGKFTGIDDMRALMLGLDYRAVGKSPIKFVIMDECHSLSAKAWNSLLKIVEEPPPHLYWAFCTTEPGKVITTIQNRCHIYNLKEVDSESIEVLLEAIAEAEELEFPKGTFSFISTKSNGSPRKAIKSLSKCIGLSSLKDIALVMEELEEDTEVIKLCKALIGARPTWPAVVEIITKLKEGNPESIRIQVCNYVRVVALREKNIERVPYFLNILDAFSKPYSQQTGHSELLLSIGTIFFGGE